MVKRTQKSYAKGSKCSGTIVSEHWVATSESCCEGAVQAIMDFDDDRDTDEGDDKDDEDSDDCETKCRRRRDSQTLRRKRRSENDENSGGISKWPKRIATETSPSISLSYHALVQK